jgi:group I intron endonuclease
MLIEKALLKYGYSSFRLEILEYCNKDEILSKEQYYMDLLKPEYNILTKAGSRLGFKHSEETKALFSKVRKEMEYSEEHKYRISKMYLYRTPESRVKDIERLLKFNEAKSHPIEVIDLSTNEKKSYPSVRQAASELAISKNTIRKYLKSQKVYKTYKFTNTNTTEQ